MKKILYLLPLLLGIFACNAQPQPTQKVTDIVNATLTAITQNNPQVVIALPTAFTPGSVQVQPTAMQPEPVTSNPPVSPGNIDYFWPLALPEGFALNRANSRADAGGFRLEFINPSSGSIYLTGGAEADQYGYCVNNPSEPVTVRGWAGCFLPSTGGGFGVEWKENSIHYILGGAGTSREFALVTAEQLEVVDLSTFLARLTP